MVPMVVAVPPMLDARATDMHSIDLMPPLAGGWSSDLASSWSSTSGVTERTSSRMASRIGIIMAQAAVLEIHIDRSAVASMNPRKDSQGIVLNNFLCYEKD